MRILDADEMRAVDRWAIEELGIPGMVLMENAAIGVADALGEIFPHCSSPVILCGPGNNGGDGLALTRLLAARGYRPSTFVVTGGGRAPVGDAGEQLSILAKSGLTPSMVDVDGDLEPLMAACRQGDLIVDSLFGTGLTRPLEGGFGRLVELVDELSVPRLAVDLPSGLDASRRELIGPVLTADSTVTFAAPKPAHIFAPSRDVCGEVVVTDLGLPPVWEVEAPGNLYLLLRGDVAALRLQRSSDAHKGDFGHCLLVAGSPGAAGAAVLAARAAVRGGAGLVTLAVPEGLMSTVGGASLESMSRALPADANGALAASAVEPLVALAEGKTAVGIGPGLGLASETSLAVREIVASLPQPVVLDADGIGAFVGRVSELAARRDRATILTPHPGELGRLLGKSSAEIQGDRLAAVAEAVERTEAVVVLKGEQTLVASPDGEIWLNPTGNAGMATGGSGDVLTGLLTSLVASGYEAATASKIAVFVHGLAGDYAAERESAESLSAGDLISGLGAAFRRISEP